MQRYKKLSETSEVRTGKFTKREAALMISEGVRHLHSSVEADPDGVLTSEALKRDSIPTYSWEQEERSHSIRLSSSSDRCALAQNFLKATSLRRELREKSESVLEELMTNAIYHGFTNADGSPRYARRATVQLNNSEELKILCFPDEKGVFFRVTDNGGSLSFEDITQSFKRCYQKKELQIQSNEQGAGLGLYMIFEEVTHLKIVSRAGEQTEVSCWIADQRFGDTHTFSFNFFAAA